MFIAKLKYLCPETAIIPSLQKQLEYLKNLLDHEKVLIIGKDYTTKEMLIISQLYHLGEFEQLIKKSPLFKEALCTYEITSFKPTFFNPLLQETITTHQIFRKIEISTYDLEWAKDYEKERILLDAIYKPILNNIHHIGSTSIPNLSAKPIIDILIEVSSIERVDPFDPLMVKHGYRPKGEYGMSGRRYFYKGNAEEDHTHHVHIFESGHPDINRHLEFKNHLIAHPEKVKAYSDLKMSLAEKYPNDIEQYCWGKNTFITKIEEDIKSLATIQSVPNNQD